MKTKLFLMLAIAGFIALSSGCKKDEDPQEAETYTLTQTDLNQATGAEDLDVTGSPYGQDVTIAHNGMAVSADSTFRDIYSNISSSESITLGTIFTKKTYLMNADGSKGMLQVTFAMAKREAGYNTDGGDWEYVMMPNNTGNDFSAQPNGVLPDISETEMRGKLAMCASCHSKKSSYIFVR